MLGTERIEAVTIAARTNKRRTELFASQAIILDCLIISVGFPPRHAKQKQEERRPCGLRSEKLWDAFQSRPSWEKVLLERESQSETELPLIVPGVGDGQETGATTARCPAANTTAGIAEVWRVEEIKSVGAELQVEALREIECTEQTEIHVH